MPYATLADLTARFGEAEVAQLTDRAGTEQVDGSVVDAALADADATIEGYLAGRYAVPVAPVPALLRRIACDLARHTLHGKSAGEAVRRAQEDALKLLRDLANGVAVLPGATAAAAGANPAADAGTVRVSAPERVFDRATSIPDFFG
ncbi:MAG: DUF1320 domain-containing protein [Acetobacteraceae bacterium]|nr:DUF1320 domain-containing protein [Acetobacteraceae bacterium]